MIVAQIMIMMMTTWMRKNDVLNLKRLVELKMTCSIKNDVFNSSIHDNVFNLE